MSFILVSFFFFCLMLIWLCSFLLICVCITHHFPSFYSLKSFNTNCIIFKVLPVSGDFCTPVAVWQHPETFFLSLQGSGAAGIWCVEAGMRLTFCMYRTEPPQPRVLWPELQCGWLTPLSAQLTILPLHVNCGVPAPYIMVLTCVPAYSHWKHSIVLFVLNSYSCFKRPFCCSFFFFFLKFQAPSGITFSSSWDFLWHSF